MTIMSSIHTTRKSCECLAIHLLSAIFLPYLIQNRIHVFLSVLYIILRLTCNTSVKPIGYWSTFDSTSIVGPTDLK